MDRFAKGVLTVIAVALCAIAVRMWMPGYATLGEMQDAAKSSNRENALADVRSRLVLVRLQGGIVDATVSGSIDVSSMP